MNIATLRAPLTVLSCAASFPELLSSALPSTVTSSLIPHISSRHLYVPLPAAPTSTFIADFHQLRQLNGMKSSSVLSIPTSLASHFTALSLNTPQFTLPKTLLPLLPPPPFTIKPDLSVQSVTVPEFTDFTTIADTVNNHYKGHPKQLLFDMTHLATFGILLDETTVVDEKLVAELIAKPDLFKIDRDLVTFQLPFLLNLLNIPFSATRYLQLTAVASAGADTLEKIEDTGAAKAVVEVIEKVSLELDMLDMDIEVPASDQELLQDLLG